MRESTLKWIRKIDLLSDLDYDPETQSYRMINPDEAPLSPGTRKALKRTDPSEFFRLDSDKVSLLESKCRAICFPSDSSQKLGGQKLEADTYCKMHYLELSE